MQNKNTKVNICIENEVCDCGTDYESVEHFLLECKLYSEDRKVMFEDIKEVLQSSKDSRYVKISVGLLQYWVKARKAAPQSLRIF